MLYSLNLVGEDGIIFFFGGGGGWSLDVSSFSLSLHVCGNAF